jgi:hypothetical protein
VSPDVDLDEADLWQRHTVQPLRGHWYRFGGCTASLLLGTVFRALPQRLRLLQAEMRWDQRYGCIPRVEIPTAKRPLTRIECGTAHHFVSLKSIKRSAPSSADGRTSTDTVLEPAALAWCRPGPIGHDRRPVSASGKLITASVVLRSAEDVQVKRFLAGHEQEQDQIGGSKSEHLQYEARQKGQRRAVQRVYSKRKSRGHRTRG